MSRAGAPMVLDRATLATIAPEGKAGPLAGPDQGALGLVPDAAVAIVDGSVAAAGPRDRVLAAHDGLDVLDLAGRVVTPGLVDAHTHPVWAGSRVDEFEMRLAGADYVAIMEAGGGIASTVRATRAATTKALTGATSGRLDALMAHGTTTAEAKTGYGLTVDEELRHLDVLRELRVSHPLRLALTFLGAHAVPPEYAGRADAYIDLVVEEMLPAVAARSGEVFCDVFCDRGAFTLQQSERVLTRARELGLPVKVHSDEFDHLGCTALAAELGAHSADHLIATTPAEMDAMAAAGTVAVLLPGTTFGLASTAYADARQMIRRGVPVALGTDLNPGTCPCPSLPFIMALACRAMGMSPAEALVACTRNAAYASGRGEVAGCVTVGRPADLAVFDADDPRDLAYWYGVNPVWRVMIGGSWVV